MPNAILVEKRDDGVALITLNRPDRLNAMTGEMLSELSASLKDCEQDAAVRCVALTGAGRAFSAGGDVKDMAADVRAVTFGGESDEEASQLLADAAISTTGTIYRLQKPVVGLINGFVMGGALGLALACDVRLASEDARFGTAFGNVGLSGDFGTTYLLPRVLGHGRARELFLSSEILSAAAAQEAGLVSGVYESDKFLHEGLAYCASVAAGPTRAFGRMKANLNFGEEHSIEDAMRQEARNQRLSALDADHREAAQAFANKKQPIFQGR